MRKAFSASNARPPSDPDPDVIDGRLKTTHAEPPAPVYIDLNHWISLSRARLGRPSMEPYADLLDVLRSAVAAGAVLAPLSETHYAEMSTIRIKDPRQRAEVALTMAELSRFATLVSRDILLADQLRRAVAQEVGSRYAAPAPVPVGHGFAHAFGQPPVIGRLKGDSSKVSDFIEQHSAEYIDRIGAFAGFGWKFSPSGSSQSEEEEFYEATDALMQFMMLRGPTDEELPALEGYGFNPLPAHELIDRIARREAELAGLLGADPDRIARLDDIVDARAMYWDLGREWQPALADLGLHLATLGDWGKERLTRIMRSMPVVDTESLIRRANFKAGKPWSANDVYDLSFAGQAVSTCNAILTEKHLHSVLHSNRWSERYRIEIFRRPAELVDWLQTRISANTSRAKQITPTN